MPPWANVWVAGRQHPAVYIIAALIFIFPITAVTVAHGATAIFSILLLMSLYYGWSGWRSLQTWEKAVLIGFIAFAAAIALSLVNAERLHDGISKYSKYLRFAAFTPMYLMVRRWHTDLSRPLIAGLVTGALVMCALAVYQHFWLHVPRPGGARNPIRFGEMLVAAGMVLTVALITRATRPWQRLVCLLAIAATIYTTYLNRTRGVQLAVPFFILLMLAYYYRRMARQGWVLAIAGIGLIGVLAFYPGSQVHRNFARGIDQIAAFVHGRAVTAHDSWGLRLSMAQVSWLIFARSPLLGTGLADYTPDAERLIHDHKTTTQAPIIATSPHSIYMHTLAISGLMGILSLVIGVFGLPAYALGRYWRQAARGEQRFSLLAGLSVLGAFAVYGISNTWTAFNNPISVYLLLMLVLLSGLAAHDRVTTGSGPA